MLRWDQLQDAEAIIRSSGIGIENAVGGFKVNVSAAVGGQAAAGLPDSALFVGRDVTKTVGRLSEAERAVAQNPSVVVDSRETFRPLHPVDPSPT